MNRIKNRIRKTMLLAMASLLILTVVSMSASAASDIVVSPATPSGLAAPAAAAHFWHATPTVTKGWYIAKDMPVTAEVKVTGAPSGEIMYYCLNTDCDEDNNGIASTKWIKYTGTPFAITAQGKNSVYHYSTDSVGAIVQALNEHEIYIDTVKPTITASVSPVTTVNGWHNAEILAGGPVTISYTCTDNGAPIGAPGICPGPDVIGVEGITTVTGTATDAAGNTASVTTVVKIDVTNPNFNERRVLTPYNLRIGPLPIPAGGNQEFWFNQNVIVNIKGEDLFGIVPLPARTATYDPVASGIDPTLFQKTLSDEGEHLSFDPSGVSYADRAGNRFTMPIAAPRDIFNIGPETGYVNIDKTAPKITVTGIADTTDTKFYKDSVTPVIAISDPNLKAYSMKLDGNVYISGTIVPEEGKHKLEISTSDIVDNVASKTINFVIDRTPPILTSSVDKTPTNGWYNTDVKVTFKATDEYDVTITSGTLTGTNTLDVPVTTEGKDQEVTATAVDKAGNAAVPKTEKISLDKTKPTISGVATPAKNGDDWNDAAVSVKFTCVESGSGIDGVCGPDVTLSTEGAGQSVTGTVKDKAGNTNSATVSGINIDLTAPVITITGVTDGGEYNPPVTPSIVIDATVSGEKSKSIILNGAPYVPGTPISTSGLKVLKVSVTDKAGRSASQSVTFTVKTGSTPDILSYYRGLTGSGSVLDTQDLLKAADDWSKGTIPPGFSEPLSTTQLLKLADEWSHA